MASGFLPKVRRYKYVYAISHGFGAWRTRRTFPDLASFVCPYRRFHGFSPRIFSKVWEKGKIRNPCLHILWPKESFVETPPPEIFTGIYFVL